MKKILLPLLMILAGSVALADPPDEDVHRPILPGRGQLYAQFDLGFNYTFLSGNSQVRARFIGLESESTIFQSATGLAPLLSASIGYDFNNMFGIVFRADVDMRSASNSGSSIDTCRIGDTLGNVIVVPVEINKAFNVDVNYLSLSALAKFRFDQLYFFLGPTVSVPISREVSETDRIVDSASVCEYFPLVPDNAKLITGSLTNSNNIKQRLSFKIGAGYMIPLTPNMSLVPQLGYDIGLSDAFKATEINPMTVDGEPDPVNALPAEINPKIRLSSLQATIGLRINL